MTKTYPNEPSFVCMYWKVTRGRQQVIWQGMIFFIVTTAFSEQMKVRCMGHSKC